MTVLIVVAHPDDEVLGCGGTIGALAERGVSARCCMLSGSVEARSGRPGVDELLGDIERAQEILGLGPPILGDFQNIRFNVVPHLELVQFIEEAILRTGATHIFTHHPSDLNNDHLHTSLACQAAARLFQRRENVPPLQGLYFMETLSSTDWAFPSHTQSFSAQSFFEIGESLERKLEALAAYRGVLRKYPHPRSPEAIRALAALRGAQAGVLYAEAFQVAFQSLRIEV